MRCATRLESCGTRRRFTCSASGLVSAHGKPCGPIFLAMPRSSTTCAQGKRPTGSALGKPRSNALRYRIDISPSSWPTRSRSFVLKPTRSSLTPCPVCDGSLGTSAWPSSPMGFWTIRCERLPERASVDCWSASSSQVTSALGNLPRRSLATCCRRLTSLASIACLWATVSRTTFWVPATAAYRASGSTGMRGRIAAVRRRVMRSPVCGT